LALQPAPAGSEPRTANRALRTAVQTQPAAELRALEEKLVSAVLANDAAALDLLLAPGFVMRGAPDVPRETWIANAVELCWGDQFEISDFRVVSQAADTAFVTFVLATNQDPATCEPADVRSLITDLWRRDGEAWRLLLRHSGPAGAGVKGQFRKTAPPPPLLEGSGELSLVATDGNTETRTLGVAGALIWRPGRWITDAKTTFVQSETSDIETTRSFVVSVRQSRTITPRLDAYGRVEYLVDRFAGIEDRVSFDAGLGYKAIERPPHALRLDLGFGYSHEDRLDVDAVGFALANAGATYAWKPTSATAVENTALFTASLDRAEDWRFRNSFSATARLTGVFAVKLAHELKYLHAPVPGFESTDTILSAALLVKF
ncbi:MAG TPA: DUF481 domain-containing protein, partial [Vicinamibacterales bacterium]|nr:DUF481 domain-containing protein [Vicinamibacterales bacterium]